jgi:tetratricopeptide (TPR) repeat protein/DNA-binding CsgD family transcriptional regulator
MKAILTLIVLFPFITIAQFDKIQQKKIDSLNTLIYTQESHDTTLAKAYVELTEILYVVSLDTIKYLCDKSLKIIEANLPTESSKPIIISYKNSKAFCYQNLTSYYFNHGDIPKSISCANNCLKIYKDLNNLDGLAIVYNNLAVINRNQGNIEHALDNYFESIKIYEQQGNIVDIYYGACLNNIGQLYYHQNEFDKAIEYMDKALIIQEKIGDKFHISNTLINMGTFYSKQGKTEAAITTFNRALSLKKEISDKKGEAKILINIGSENQIIKEYKVALEYFNDALDISEKTFDKISIIICQTNIGSVYFAQNKLKKSKIILTKAYLLAKSIGFPQEQSRIAKLLSDVNQAIGNYEGAYDMYQNYILMRDSINNTKNQKATIRQQFKYDYEKQTALDSIAHVKETELLDDNILKQELIIKNKKQKEHFLVGGLALLSIFAGFMFNRFKASNTQKKIIETQKQEVETQRDYAESEHKKAENLRLIAEAQKEIVEEKNLKILDSITYAKRLQNAILPSSHVFKKWLIDSFIFYKPKDIVAGDFYWMEVIKRENRNIIFYAVADCTGHGVPGAMVSVVCSNALNRSVKEFKITDPAKLLDKVTELVKEAFAKSDETIKDGMDIAICALDLVDKKVWYAGANNPLYRITDLQTEISGEHRIMQIDQRKLIEYKADKQPIGEYEYMKPFTTTEIQLEPRDCIYIFSDGFSDQFGGEKGKKYKSANFKRFLMQIESKEMDAQKEILDTEINRWRGEIEQVDDICVIGLRINDHMYGIFTSRELSIIKRILEGKLPKAITEELMLTKNEFETDRKRISAKTNTKNSLELSKFCETHNVIG